MYQGYKSWNQWNVSLWINNDEGLYRLAKESIKFAGVRKAAAQWFLSELAEQGITHTPDGAPYTVTAIRAAMRGM